jgi:multicomponent Na+:H+ antiporter subunit E
MSRWALTPILLAVWLLLWGELSIGNVIGGLLVIGLLLVVFPLQRQPRQHRLSPWGALRLMVRFLGDLVVSSVRVLTTVVLPTPQRLRSGIVKVPLTCDSPLVMKTVSDLLCLTPGTLTVEIDVDPVVLYVHVLGLRDHDRIRTDIMALERRVLAALPPVAPPRSDVEVRP